MDEEREPWSRLDGENTTWYRRFREYLINRSLLSIYNAEREAAKKSPLSSTPGAWKEARDRSLQLGGPRRRVGCQPSER